MDQNNTILPRAQWQSYPSYLLVTIGAIVGLGNIFYFPFFVAKFGGLFVLLYIVCELFLSIPLLFAELFIGRRGKQNPVGAISLLAIESNANQSWRLVGWICFIISFLTLSYYTIMVTLPLSYFLDTVPFLFSGEPLTPYPLTTKPITANFFSLEIYFFIFLFFTMIVIGRGINRGLEQISRITVPVYFIIFCILAFYVSTNSHFLTSIRHLFSFSFDQPLWPVLLTALTFAFFKLNVGMGSMMVYGSYLPYSVPLAKSTVVIVCLDAIVSLLAYFIIYPLALQSLIPTGENISYENIKLIFSAVPHGVMIATLFFFAAVIAAWTATIALAETATLTLIERFQLSRPRATILISLGVVVVGTLITLSFYSCRCISIFSIWTVAGFIKNFASDIATPIAAIFIAIFSSWVVTREISQDELHFIPWIYKLWRFLLRYVAPICIFIILCAIGFN